MQTTIDELDELLAEARERQQEMQEEDSWVASEMVRRLKEYRVAR